MNSVSAHAQVQHTHRPSWAFQALARPSKHQRNGKCSNPRIVTVRAEKSGLERLLQPFEGFSKEEEVSFRWDPANLRWAKSKTKMADDASMMITPLIGEPYLVSPCFVSQLPAASQQLQSVLVLQVWPAVHNYLQRKKLKTISPEEVSSLECSSDTPFQPCCPC